MKRRMMEKEKEKGSGSGGYSEGSSPGGSSSGDSSQEGSSLAPSQEQLNGAEPGPSSSSPSSTERSLFSEFEKILIDQDREGTSSLGRLQKVKKNLSEIELPSVERLQKEYSICIKEATPYLREAYVGAKFYLEHKKKLTVKEEEQDVLSDQCNFLTELQSSVEQILDDNGLWDVSEGGSFEEAISGSTQCLIVLYYAFGLYTEKFDPKKPCPHLLFKHKMALFILNQLRKVLNRCVVAKNLNEELEILVRMYFLVCDICKFTADIAQEGINIIGRQTPGRAAFLPEWRRISDTRNRINIESLGVGCQLIRWIRECERKLTSSREEVEGEEAEDGIKENLQSIRNIHNQTIEKLKQYSARSHAQFDQGTNSETGISSSNSCPPVKSPFSKLKDLREEICNYTPFKELQQGGAQHKKNQEPEAASAAVEAADAAQGGAEAAAAGAVLEKAETVILDGVKVEAESLVMEEVEVEVEEQAVEQAEEQVEEHAEEEAEEYAEEEAEEEAEEYAEEEAEEEEEKQDEKRQKVGMGGKVHVPASNGFDSPQVVRRSSPPPSLGSSSGAGMFGHSSQDDAPIQAIPESEREEYVNIISRFATLLNDKTLQDVIGPCLLATILEEFESWYPPVLRDDSRCVADFWRVQFMENKYNAVYSKIEELLKKLRPCQKEHIVTCNKLRIISVGILGLLQNVSTPLPGPR